MWGQAKRSVNVIFVCGDHPHACGDKRQIPMFGYVGVGSSPRVWGQAAQGAIMKCYGGIIPTRVGTSSTGCDNEMLRRDHPHACGDKNGILRFWHSERGSSPRVWGQEACLIIESLGIRIIPTRVGTSYKTPLTSF